MYTVLTSLNVAVCPTHTVAGLFIKFAVGLLYITIVAVFVLTANPFVTVKVTVYVPVVI